MGGGKSTILQELSKLEYKCITEPARQILKEQRAAGKEGTPDTNPTLFNELMLEKMISDYDSSTFEFFVPIGSEEVEIIGTNVIPEFPVGAIFGFVVMISFIMIFAKVKAPFFKL